MNIISSTICFHCFFLSMAYLGPVESASYHFSIIFVTPCLVFCLFYPISWDPWIVFNSIASFDCAKMVFPQASHEPTEVEYNALLISYGKDNGKGKASDEPNQQVDNFIVLYSMPFLCSSPPCMESSLKCTLLLGMHYYWITLRPGFLSSSR